MPPAIPLVAIVDDDAAVRRALTRLLGASGIEALAYESADAFLASLDARVPACAIFDLVMPQMTGLELQQELLDRRIAMPVIIITGHETPGAEQYCRAAGVVAYLRKPVNGAALFAAIAQATGLSEGSLA